MKRVFDTTKLSDHTLMAVLIFLILGSAFALVHAFSGGSGFAALAPLLLPA